MESSISKNHLGLSLGKNPLLVAAVLILVVAPLYVRRGADFAGADDSARNAISEIRPGYQPWIKPLWEPPGGEIASLLFSLQSAAGAGFIGYYFGLQRGRRKAAENRPDDAKRQRAATSRD
ncbi:MAG: energy-coupling factor ABC transporter substrate-binding protein [bacterium]|nr:energy-coupling factor ABC transporter substrate-binding protein [bacterium]